MEGMEGKSKKKKGGKERWSSQPTVAYLAHNALKLRPCTKVKVANDTSKVRFERREGEASWLR